MTIKKTEYLKLGLYEENDNIIVSGTPLKRAKTFTYLGSTLTNDGNCEHDVKARISSAWTKWRSLTGVLCDKRMPNKLKGKLYRTVARPAMMYGSEC